MLYILKKQCGLALWHLTRSNFLCHWVLSNICYKWKYQKKSTRLPFNCPSSPCLLPGHTIQWLSNALRANLNSFSLSTRLSVTCFWPASPAPSLWSARCSPGSCGGDLLSVHLDSGCSIGDSSSLHPGNGIFMPGSTWWERPLSSFPQIVYQFLLLVKHITQS